MNNTRNSPTPTSEALTQLAQSEAYQFLVRVNPDPRRRLKALDYMILSYTSQKASQRDPKVLERLNGMIHLTQRELLGLLK